MFDFLGLGPKLAGEGPARWSLPSKVLLKRHAAEDLSGHLVCRRAFPEGGWNELRWRVLKPLPKINRTNDFSVCAGCEIWRARVHASSTLKNNATRKGEQTNIYKFHCFHPVGGVVFT